MIRIKLLLMFTIILKINPCLGQSDGWVEKYNRNQLSIQIRHNKPNKTVEFKSMITVDSHIDTCIATLLNFDLHPEFLYRVKSVKLIDHSDETAPCLYYTMDFPFPLSDRDMIVDGSITKDPQSGEMTILLKSNPEKMPLTKYVRIKDVDGSWVLKKINDSQTQITNYGISTTRGLPTWLVNLLVLQIPKSTLTKLRRIVETKPTMTK